MLVNFNTYQFFIKNPTESRPWISNLRWSWPSIRSTSQTYELNHGRWLTPTSQLSKMNPDRWFDPFLKPLKMNLSHQLILTSKRPKTNIFHWSNQTFKCSKPYEFLNLSKLIWAIDHNIKHDLDRRSTKLYATLQRPLKLEFWPSRSNLTLQICRFTLFNLS